MRTAIVSLMKMEAQLIGSQKKSFIKFDGQVEQAAEAFEAAETANADQLAAILAGLDQSPTSGSGTPVDSSAPAANSGTDAGASSSEPAQNAPSAI